MQKLVDAGMVNEVVSAETMMEQLIKEKSKIMHVGKSFVIYDPNGRIMEHTAAGFHIFEIILPIQSLTFFGEVLLFIKSVNQ